MKFKPGWSFWLNIFCVFSNLSLFVATKSILAFVVSIVCCVCALTIWKSEKLMFDFDQNKLKNSFERKKKEENKDV